MRLSLIAALLLFGSALASGCDSEKVQGDEVKTMMDKADVPVGNCPLMDVSDLNLWINAMPSRDGSKLIAIFKATTPTPGYTFRGEVTEVQESDPPSYTIEVMPMKPTGMVTQVLTPSEIRLDVPIQSFEARSVTLTCQGQTLFTVNEVMSVR